MTRQLSVLAATLAAASLLSACAPLVVGGAMVGGAMVMTDRRTSGAQLEDQNIEVKASTRIREAVGERGHVIPTSYNRMLLVTGEAVSDADKAAIDQHLARLENVRSIVNEVAVMPATSMSSRSNDTYLTSKVKASFVDAKDMQVNAIKVVTERGTVYLMGKVTEREAARAAEIARGISGVQKVVRVFEVITEAELAELATRK